MSFQTHKIRNLKLNYENTNLENKEGFYQFKIGKIVDEITILINEDTFLPVNCVNSYLIYRHHIGKTNSSFECRALRLYFDFIEAMEVEWDHGSDLIHQRPLSMFSKYLKDEFEANNISGTSAVNYFNAVARFYKFHLQQGHKFKGTPVTFSKHQIEVNSKSLTSHIKNYKIDVDVADCRPRIPTNAKSSELIPFNIDNYKFLFNQINEHSTKEMALICLLSANTGLRANEIADLRLDMIKDFNGEEVFDLYVGPQRSHKTKFSKNGVVKVSGKLIELIQKYNRSSRYLKRLAKYKGDRANVFLTVRGSAFTQQTISVLFSNLTSNFIKPVIPSFKHNFHDLRVTFGVNTMKACLDSNMSRKDALAYTQNQMRHKSIDTTMQYLEYWTHSVITSKRNDLQKKI